MTISELLKKAQSTLLSPGEPCLFCRKPAEYRGVFLPYRSQEWGGSAAKQRALLYATCRRCRHRADMIEAVEDSLYRRLTAGWN